MQNAMQFSNEKFRVIIFHTINQIRKNNMTMIEIFNETLFYNNIFSFIEIIQQEQQENKSKINIQKVEK